MHNATRDRLAQCRADTGAPLNWQFSQAMSISKLKPEIDFGASAFLVAKQLIGTCLLINGVGGIIVETEAYDQSEAASHGFTGPSLGNAALFGPPGRAYVYRSYGIHWCLNIVCREIGHAAGVLIRALEPTSGIRSMKRRRGSTELRLLCSGPGRVGEALAVSDALNGKRIDRAPFRLLPSLVIPAVVRGKRIGISKATERAWRFGLQGSTFVSRPF